MKPRNGVTTPQIGAGMELKTFPSKRCQRWPTIFAVMPNPWQCSAKRNPATLEEAGGKAGLLWENTPINKISPWQRVGEENFWEARSRQVTSTELPRLNWVCVTTSVVWLPRTKRLMPRRPCDDMTIKSRPSRSARRTIASEGCMSPVSHVFQARSPPNQLSYVLRTSHEGLRNVVRSSGLLHRDKWRV